MKIITKIKRTRSKHYETASSQILKEEFRCEPHMYYIEHKRRKTRTSKNKK